MLIKFFHHLFNPHCEKCEENEIVSILKYQIQVLTNEKKELLEQILHTIKPVTAAQTELPVNPQPIRRASLPFTARARMREEADRIQARILAEQNRNYQVDKNSIEALEKELGLGVEDDRAAE